MGKRLKNIFLLIFILFLVSCSNDVIKPELALESSLEATMKILTSEEFKGRLTGTEGNEKAVLYIENRFKEIGLAPYTGESYLHEYEQTIYHPDEQQHSIIVEYEDGSTEELKLGVDYMYRTLIENNDVKLPVTFDINDTEMSDKVTILGESDHLSKVMQKSKGAIIKSESFLGSSHSRLSPYPIIDITEDTYERMLSKKAKTVNIKSKHISQGVTAKNVVGKIPGKNNKKALVLSAHFDHVGWVGENIFYGAVDNASGTTVLLDVAERLEKHSDTNPFDMDILICAFNGEEFPVLGSTAFANEICLKYDELYNVNIDCVGSKVGGKIRLGNNDIISEELIDELKKYLDKYSIEYSDEYYGTSDHSPFISNNKCGITIGHLDFRDFGTYHTPKDTIEEVDFEYLRKISNVIYDFVLSNDGRVFNLISDTEKRESENEPSEETWNKAQDMAKQLKEEQDIQFDEALRFIVDDYIFIVNGENTLYSIEEVNKYFPNMKVPENISDYNFNNITIEELGEDIYPFVTYILDNSNFKGELGKKYKRETNTENIHSISIDYLKDDYAIEILVYNTNKHKIRDSSIEDIKLDGDKSGYYLMKFKESDNYRGFKIKHKDNGKSYEIRITKGEARYENDVFIGSHISNTKDDIIKLIEELRIDDNIEKIINDLGI